MGTQPVPPGAGLDAELQRRHDAAQHTRRRVALKRLERIEELIRRNHGTLGRITTRLVLEHAETARLQLEAHQAAEQEMRQPDVFEAMLAAARAETDERVSAEERQRRERQRHHTNGGAIS